jgi:transcriptional regulator with XRE-family HTH domain
MEARPYTTTETDLKLLKKMQFGQRMKWIREKANELHHGEFSINELANKADIAPSSLLRIEDGDSKDTKSLVLIKLANCMSVPVEVFHDPYYENTLREFTICGVSEATRNWHLTDIAYKVQLQLQVFSPQNIEVQAIDETLGLSVLEYEEFIGEVRQLLQKVRDRRNRWNKMLESYKLLSNS